MPQGVDVHGDKGWVDWRRARADGLDFAFVKCTEGLTFNDRRTAENLRNARAAGVLCGLYHYGLHYKWPPEVAPDMRRAIPEADHFVRQALRVGWDAARDGMLVLDMEEAAGNWTPWVLAFLKRVEALTGTAPGLYISQGAIRSHIRADFEELEDALSHYPLWMASWGPNDGLRHLVIQGVPPWERWTVHQYTSMGRVAGVPGFCDRNYAPHLSALEARPDVSGKPMWQWIRWWRGHGEFRAFGKRNYKVRPPVPKRVPKAWWARLRKNLGRA